MTKFKNIVSFGAPTVLLTVKIVTLFCDMVCRFGEEVSTFLTSYLLTKSRDQDIGEFYKKERMRSYDDMQTSFLRGFMRDIMHALLPTIKEKFGPVAATKVVGTALKHIPVLGGITSSILTGVTDMLTNVMLNAAQEALENKVMEICVTQSIASLQNTFFNSCGVLFDNLMFW